MNKKLSRRSAVQKVSYLVGGAVATPTLLSVMQSCKKEVPLNWTPSFLNQEQSRMVHVLTDLIIPPTGTAGAVDAGVPAFIDQILQECLNDEQRALFTDGLTNLESTSQDQYGKKFIRLDAEQQSDLLTQFGKQAESVEDAHTSYNDDSKSFFEQLKQLTLLGYFSSEMGATQALAFVQVPGSYQGCIPLEPDQKTWAEQ